MKINELNQTEPITTILGLSINCFRSKIQPGWFQVKNIKKVGSSAVIKLQDAYDQEFYEALISSPESILELKFAKKALSNGLFDSEEQLQTEWSKFLQKNNSVFRPSPSKARS